MKFFKGVIVGTMLGAGAWMMYNESSKSSKKKVLKNGKRIIKNMGLM